MFNTSMNLFLMTFNFVFKNHTLMLIILTMEFISLNTIFLSFFIYLNLTNFIYSLLLLIFFSLDSIILLLLYILSVHCYTKDYSVIFF